MTKPLLANLVCGSPARNHDFDFARRALLDALYAAGDIRTDVYSNYDAGQAVEAGDLLVSYTSQVPVADSHCEALRRYLERGGRWFAIHASNSVRDNVHLPGILGSRFLAHPPYMRYSVTVSRPGDPLMAGIDPAFDVDDELYIIEQHADFEVLLETRWGGEAMSQSYPETVRPLMYRHRVGAGGVLYLALGHCNRAFDVPRPGMPDAPDRRGPWSTALYQELIRRGIDWAAQRRPL
ncbi:MAG: ThuA domain-containing protein [Streptosporangiaceae bacterium]